MFTMMMMMVHALIVEWQTAAAVALVLRSSVGCHQTIIMIIIRVRVYRVAKTRTIISRHWIRQAKRQAGAIFIINVYVWHVP